jgi:hypothetical protein
MRINRLLVAFAAVLSLQIGAQKITTIDPNQLQLSPRRQAELPISLLKRIRATTNVFEKVDGISYEQAVDLYKRDVNPEENLVLFEEMARVYTMFCKFRCKSTTEQQDAYRALLLRTGFDNDEASRQTNPVVLTNAEVSSVVKLYRLPAKPIEVVKTR